jgi:tetratricopeptide (TPR) repeat protein
VEAHEAEALLQFAERAGPGLKGLDSKVLFEQLEQRHDDLLAALQWFIDQGKTDDALRLARWLAPFWTATRRLDEGSEWFDRVLASPGGDDGNRGRASNEAAFVVFWQGADDRASVLFDEALAFGRRIDDPAVAAMALTGLARVALRTDVEEARRLCREALALAEGADDPIGRSSAMHVLGVAAQMAGDLVEAREFMTRQIALAREMGSARGIAVEASNLSMVERQLGDLEAAEAWARQGLDIARQRDDEWQFPYATNSLAAIATDRGDFERGATLIGAAESMMEAQGAAWPPDERPHYERTLATLAASLPPREFDRARSTGHSMASGAAVDYALGSGPGDRRSRRGEPPSLDDVAR